MNMRFCMVGTQEIILYYGFPIVKPDDIEDIYIGRTGGRLDLVPAHLLWSNLSKTQRADMNNLLNIIREWWEFPRWISTILFSGLLFWTSSLATNNDPVSFVNTCLQGGIIILITTIIESVIVSSRYIKSVALNYPLITMLISWIALAVCTITALINSYVVSIILALGWIVIVYVITLSTRVIVWRIRSNQFMLKN